MKKLNYNKEMESKVKAELVEYLLKQNSEIITRILTLEKKIQIKWDSDEYDDESVERWTKEINELWGMLVFILRLFEYFKLDRRIELGGEIYEVHLFDNTIS